ncbi:MAG: DNAase [Gammaproteobacteria bacterium RBG_16_57_12]|nr:MAG: DNAase [Gammaproteobacteria bacterium RBG_16_57_12]
MELIDTHCHLDVSDFNADRDVILARCRALGITRIIVPAVDAEGWPQLLALCRRQPGLYPALGLHPLYIDKHTDQHLADLERRLSGNNVVAVGEIGLDYFVEPTDKNRQQALFEAQLALARTANLPVLLHVRKAHDQVLATLRRLRVRGGIAHAFNGSRQQADQYLALGFKLGFGGMLTYERASRIRALARQLPLEALVLETDAPDMAVSAHQGERNSPEYLPDCLKALAELREEPVEQLAVQTTRNAMEVLRLHD